MKSRDGQREENNNKTTRQMAVKTEKTKNKSFILRIDSDMMDAIEAWAADEFRSTNGQLQWIIAEALRKAGRLPKKRKTIKTETEDVDN